MKLLGARPRAAMAACLGTVVAGASAMALAIPAASFSHPPPLANRCTAISSPASGGFIATAGPTEYAAHARSKRAAAAFYLKPTGLGTYLLFDQGGKLLSLPRSGSAPVRADTAGPRAQWRFVPGPITGSFAIRSTLNRQALTIRRGDSALTLTADHATNIRFERDTGCASFPEADAGISGTTFRGTRRGGKLLGFVDAHLHITANMRVGGLVISGERFDRFGITAALGHDATAHGADGRLDYTGNLLRTGNPVGTHDNHGWPTFAGWPTHNAQTHQQTYYVWLQRAWEAGERLVVAQTVTDESLCRLEPRRADSCDETVRSRRRSERCGRCRTTSMRSTAGAGAAASGSSTARTRHGV